LGTTMQVAQIFKGPRRYGEPRKEELPVLAERAGASKAEH